MSTLITDICSSYITFREKSGKPKDVATPNSDDVDTTAPKGTTNPDTIMDTSNLSSGTVISDQSTALEVQTQKI